jgi:hypothetical protein
MKNPNAKPLSSGERRAIARILGINVLTDADVQNARDGSDTITQAMLDDHWDLIPPKVQYELLIEWLEVKAKANL